MPVTLPDPQLPGDPQDALQSIQRNFEALAQTLAPPVPTGTVLPYAASTAPNGYLICDGSEVAVKDYPTLDALLGTTYGARTNGSGGAGSTHFRLPDMKGRVVVGRDPGDALFDNLNDKLGSKTVTLDSTHIPPHTHDITVAYAQASNTATGGTGNRSSLEGTGNTQTYTSTSFGGSGSPAAAQAHDNLQPSIVLNYIIKA